MSDIPQYLDTPEEEVTATSGYNLAAEHAVLGGLLQEPGAYDQIVGLLAPTDFYNRQHAVVFEVITGMIDAGKPVDTITVAEALEAAGELNRIGGLAYLVELVQNVPGAANIKRYAEIVRERAVYRALSEIGLEAATAAARPGALQDKLNGVQEKLNSLSDRQVAKKPVRIGELILPVAQEIERAIENGGFVGYSTGLVDLDEKTAGLAPGDLVIIAGRPGMGKTALAAGIGEHVAIQLDQPVLMWIGEMRNVAVAKRMLAGAGRINSQAMRTGNMTGDDWDRFMLASEKLKDIDFYIDDESGMTIPLLRSKLRQMHWAKGEGLLIVDYLQLLEGTKKTDSRTNEIGEISRGLKAIAMDYQIPVIALASLNRSVEQRPNKRPNMADLRESGQIESDADLIVFVYRDEYYNPETEYKGLAELIIAKQRGGTTGTIMATFMGEHTRFMNYSGAPIAENYNHKPHRGFTE